MRTSLHGSRIVPLTGITNLRDLGGYAAAAGRTVRWKQLYRSAALNGMTDSDRQFLLSLGIRQVYDLRSIAERAGATDAAHALPNVLYHAADHDEAPGDIERLMRTRRVDRGKSREIMLDLYRQLPLLFRATYAALFQQIVAGELPLLFHCAVGKDRTGVAAALVLSALGVGREQIVEDYLLTEQFFERTCATVLRGHFGELFAQSEQADWDPLVRADASYLHAMFDHLQLRYGGVDAYLEEQLSLSPAARATMRNRLLE